MSDQWNPSMVPEGSIPDGADQEQADGATGDASESSVTAPIVLPAAGSGDLAPQAPGGGEASPTEPVTVVPGPATPPAGTWTPYPGQPHAGAPSAGAPYAAGPYAAGPYAGGPHPGAPYAGGPYAGASWAGPYADPAAAGGAGAPPPGGPWPAAWYPYQTPPPSHAHKPARRGVVGGVAAAVLAVAVLAGVGLGQVVWPSNSTVSSSSAPGGSAGSGSSGGTGGSTNPFGGFGSSGSGSGSGTASGAPANVAAIAAKVDPGLVDINTNLSYQNEQAAGTGQVLTPDGEVLTNNHVIDGATSISVTDIGNGKTYSASVVGYDRTQDVAVIQLKGASGLATVTPSSSPAQVGQAVVGIGNAGGTGGTPSTAGGSVTALNQSITASDDNGGNAEHLSGLIQTNAPIQAGDSGGPLVNTSGEVVGMDTAASASSYASSQGTTAYAIPIATALRLARQIEAGQASSTVHIGETAFLGVSVSNGGSTGNSSNGFGGSGGFGGSSGFGNGVGGSTGSGSGTSTSGAVVQGTVSSGPAAQAGITQGDTITSVSGTTVTSATDLSNILSRYHPGNTVTVQWTDTSGTTQSAQVKLTVGPAA